MENNKQRSYAQLGIGIFLLLAGIALMLDKFDIFTVRSGWHFWPVILIVIGTGKLSDAASKAEFGKAFWFLFLGAWFLVSELHLFGLSYHDSWPVLIIGIGVGILWKSYYSSQLHKI